MKIPASIRRLHEDQKAINDRLQIIVDECMKGLKKPRWHYESRVKELHSFALKIETGRFKHPHALEDFFACTLVVANATEIADAEAKVQELCSIVGRRPKKTDHTSSSSDSFRFDDLRLYVTLRERLAQLPADLMNLVFEVQIKTFLQHAWSIATHDFLYKTDDVNWSKERIAYQIRAMLEHAEVSIQEAESLAACAALAKEDEQTTTIKEGIRLVKAQWAEDELPSDVRRLAMNIVAVMQALRLKIGRLEQILNEGRAQRAGAHPLNLSPYGTIVQYLFNSEGAKMIELLKDKKAKTRILIPEEVILPAGVNRDELKNAVFISTGRTEDQHQPRT